MKRCSASSRRSSQGGIRQLSAVLVPASAHSRQEAPPPAGWALGCTLQPPAGWALGCALQLQAHCRLCLAGRRHKHRRRAQVGAGPPSPCSPSAAHQAPGSFDVAGRDSGTAAADGRCRPPCSRSCRTRTPTQHCCVRLENQERGRLSAHGNQIRRAS